MLRVGLLFDFELTRRAGDAAEIAARGVEEGRRFIVAVGGDGTVNEVVNGMLRSGRAADLVLGIVPAGTAHMASYSLGIGDYVQACARLAGEGRVQIDLGAVMCRSQGKAVERLFLNEASVGLPAEIVGRWRSLPSGTGRAVNLPLRTLAGYRAVAAHRNRAVKLRIGDGVGSETVCAVFVANGRYCADRMLIAPHASLQDGFLDAIVVGDLSTAEMLRLRPHLYDGSYVSHRRIRETRVTGISVEADQPLLVEADGDVVGETPVSFTVVPSALTVAV
jgi:diacylglycerol kinase family enzyme